MKTADAGRDRPNASRWNKRTNGKNADYSTNVEGRFTPLRDDAQPFVLPPNEHLEQLLLGALLADNARLTDVANLKPEHFGYAAHGRVFAMLRYMIVEKKLPATAKSLAYMLNGEAPLVSQIAASAVTDAPLAVKHWARELITLHGWRQALAFACDSQRIFTEAPQEHSYVPRLEAWFDEVVNLREAYRRDVPQAGSDPVLSAEDWRERPTPEPDFLLGQWLSTTSRMMLIGATGIGKTNWLMALGMAASIGDDFLHWKGSGHSRKVLFIDGEMSRRQLKRRILDASQRCSRFPDSFFVLSAEDANIPLFLDTIQGQEFVERQIERLGGVDLIGFDNINCLFTRDDSFGAATWAATLPWQLSLTSRAIGQIWVHHTGHDESHGYGSKMREAPLDTVALLEQVEDPALVAFRLNFTKKRECGPENLRDFDTAKITLDDTGWVSERGGDHKRTRKISPKGQAFLDALCNVLGKDSVSRPQSGGRPSVSIEAWESECLSRGLLDESKPHSMRSLLSQYRLELSAAHLIVCNVGFVWMP